MVAVEGSIGKFMKIYETMQQMTVDEMSRAISSLFIEVIRETVKKIIGEAPLYEPEDLVGIYNGIKEWLESEI